MFQETLIFCLVGFASARISIWDDLDDWNIDQRSSLLVGKFMNDGKTKESNLICGSDDCLKNAERILNNMKPSVNPCENFYEYSCGKWVENNPIPPNTGVWNPRRMMHSNSIKLLQGILEEKGPNTDISLEKAKTWYNSCMNTDSLESRNIEPVASILIKTGGWPLAMNPEEWKENEYSWQKVDKFYSQLIGKNAFFSIEVIPDLGETHDYMLLINYPKLPLSLKIYYDRNKMYADRKYKNLIIEVALAISKQIGSNVSRRKIEEEVDDFLELERQINGVMTKGLRWGKRQTIEELQKFLKDVRSRNPTSKLNFLNVINDILEEVNIKVNGTEQVKVKVMGYLPTLIYVLDQTPARTIVNFVQWSFISNVIDYLNEKFRTMKFDVTKDFYGIKEIEPRSEKCVDSVKMTHTLANEFAKKYFKTPVKDMATEMTRVIQNQLEKVVQESTWMDAAAKNESVEKVRGIIKLIGYPDWYDNKSALLAEYDGLSIGSQYFENELNFANYDFKKTFKKLGQPSDFYGWLSNPLMINAYYILITNSMVIPASSFQSPFFTPSQPDTLNYGFIGFFIAHEMSHAFDIQGQRFDKNGDFSSWEKTTLDKYENRTICFVEQTIEMTKNEKKSKFEEQHGTGLITQNDNIADTMGLQILFGAYKEEAKKKRQLKLPGLENFTDDQLFFLTFASFWCESLTPEMQAFQAEDDSHNKAKYRVIGSVSNSKDFAKAFQCPIGSLMNPKKKCSVFE